MIAPANASTLPRETNSQYSPSSKISRDPPGHLVDIIGSPHAIASTKTLPNPFQFDVRTKGSEAEQKGYRFS